MSINGRLEHHKILFILQSHVMSIDSFAEAICSTFKFPSAVKRPFSQTYSAISIFNGWELEGSHKCGLIIYTIDQIISDIHEQTITINAIEPIFLFHLTNNRPLLAGKRANETAILVVSNDVVNYSVAVLKV